MNCPACANSMKTVHYEGIEIETCESCAGEWLDGDELGKIIKIRDVRFNAEEVQTLSTVKSLPGVKPESVDRNLSCAGCGQAMEPINYGGTTGLFIDRCTGCGGFWLDDKELEKVQVLVESWEAELPADMKKFGAKLGRIAAVWDEEDNVSPSSIPVIGPFINACINGILDVTLKS